jgi:hypothetical protein
LEPLKSSSSVNEAKESVDQQNPQASQKDDVAESGALLTAEEEAELAELMADD